MDVRRFPTSKFESYEKENLKVELEKEGIKYHHLVDLGVIEKKDMKKGWKESNGSPVLKN